MSISKWVNPKSPELVDPNKNFEFRGYLETSSVTSTDFVISKALPSSNETTMKHCIANEPNDAKLIGNQAIRLESHRRILLLGLHLGWKDVVSLPTSSNILAKGLGPDGSSNKPFSHESDRIQASYFQIPANPPQLLSWLEWLDCTREEVICTSCIVHGSWSLCLMINRSIQSAPAIEIGNEGWDNLCEVCAKVRLLV